MTQFTGSTPSPQSGSKLVVIGLVVALAAVVMVNVYVEVVRRQATPGEFVIYQLNRSVRPGDKLTERMVDVTPIPDFEDFRRSFSNAIDEDGLQARLGEVFRRPASAGDFLTANLFIDPEQNELDRQISTDMRLVPLPINPKTMPAVLRPGMYVDIEAPFPGQGAVANVLPVLELVQVMAVDNYTVVDERSGETGRAPRRVTSIMIQVTPDQATQLSKIEKITTGDFELHLRKPGDLGRPKIPDGGINPRVLTLLEGRGALLGTPPQR